MVYMTPSDLGWIPYLDSWLRVYIANDLPVKVEEGARKKSGSAAAKVVTESQAILTAE
jgi:hypothetical protein